jgi:hypothetical protein
MTDEAMSPLRRRMIEDMTIRCATPVLPIAIGRPSSPHLRPLPKQAVNAPQQHTVGIEIPIASDAPLCPTSRGFLPWRLSDAGRRTCRAVPQAAGIRNSSHFRTHAPQQSAAIRSPCGHWRATRATPLSEGLQ